MPANPLDNDEVPPLIDSDASDTDEDDHMPPLIDSDSSDTEEAEGNTVPDLIADPSDDEEDAVTAHWEGKQAHLQLCEAEKQAQSDRVAEERTKRMIAKNARKAARLEQQAKDEEIRLEREHRRQERQQQKQKRELELKEKTQLELQEYAETYARRLLDGIARYLEHDFTMALSLFQAALKMVDDQHSVATLEAAMSPASCDLLSHLLNPENRYLTDYLVVRCLFESDHDDVRGEQIIDKISTLITKFRSPFMFWLYGRVLNRYRPHSDDIQKQLFLARDGAERDISESCYLLDGCMLAESGKGILLGLIAEELEALSRRPGPAAICQYGGCTTPKIYWTSTTADHQVTYAKIVCVSDHDEQHEHLFHKSCWRNLAKKRYSGASRAECIGLPCSVSECAAVIANYRDINSDGSVRKTNRSATAATITSNHSQTKSTKVAIAASVDTPLSTCLLEEEEEEDEEEEPTENEEVKTFRTERSEVSAYSIDLSAATVIQPRDRLQDTGTGSERRQTTRRIKKNKDKGVMSLATFLEKEEAKEAEKEAERLRNLAQLSPDERAVEDLKHTVKALARRRTVKKLVRPKPDPVT